MKIFKEMVTLVNNQRLNKIDLIEEKQSNGNDNLYLQLYKGIAEGTFNTDEDAATSLYQTHPRDKKYLMLKSRLKERLINTLFFLNHKRLQDSSYQKAVYQCNRNYFCAKILITHGARTSAVSLAKNTLALAEQFDLNEIVLLCSRMLRHHFGMMGLKLEYSHFNDVAKRSLRLLKAENRAESMYEYLMASVARSKAYKPELAALAKEYFNQSKELSKYQKSFHLNLLHYRIGLLYYQVIRNHKLTLSLCNRLQIFLKKHGRFRVASREGEIALLKMVCCLNLRDFNKGKDNAEDALKYYSEGSNNWFVLMENYYLLAMHAGKYKQAAEIYEKVVNHSRFQYLSAEKIEEWKIFEAYLNYVKPEMLHGKEFKVLKFLNEVPIYSKDKVGLFPSIVISQILYMIDRRDEELVEKHVESLRIFSSRHLSGKRAPRTTNFIRMLRQLVTCKYNPDKVRLKTLPYLKKLKVSEFSNQAETEAMEIIPYENLWSILLSRLPAKKRAVMLADG
jgi:hypothetical protein